MDPYIKFCNGFWTSHFFARAARVRSARKAAKTRKFNKMAKEQAKDWVNADYVLHKSEK